MKNKINTIEEKDLRTFSHDIKSLITSMYSYNQLLQKYATKIEDNNVLNYSLRMQEQIQKLIKMIEEFTQHH